jgi:hypothetical protein
MPAVDAAPAAGQRRANYLHVLPHRRDGVGKLQAPHAFDRDLVADPDAEDESALRHLVESGRHLRHRRGVPRVDGQHAGSELHPLGGRGVGGEDERTVARIR